MWRMASRKFIVICVLFIVLISEIIMIAVKCLDYYDNKIILGGKLIEERDWIYSEDVFSQEKDVEKYFRPSSLPVLNKNNDINKLLAESEMNTGKIIDIPSEYLDNPEDAIVNYFSVLREAANPIKGKLTGCGTLGYTRAPYPIAYNFFTDEYKNNISYKKYENSFKNILHINLIKFNKINNNNNTDKFFYEIETIQGSETGIGYFGYYYGYMNIESDNGIYKISDISITPEEYLCAPYHSWFYDADESLLTKYGNWCNLIKKIYDVTIDGYVKEIYFDGTDGEQYKIKFIKLTNDYDIEVAQYRKNNTGQWENIKLNPEDCLKDK